MNKRVDIGRSSVEIKDDPLLQMVRSIEEADGAYVKIGLFGNKNQRPDKGPNNATIGAAHEFGVISKNLPRRSFLRDPVAFYLPDAIKAIGDTAWRDLIVQKGFVAALQQLGVLAISVVQDAFDTGGFGTWKPLRPATIAAKGSSAILIDTGEMRRAVHFVVVMPRKGP